MHTLKERTMVSKFIILVVMFGYVKSEAATQLKDMLIDKHNELRRLQNASDMNALVWSDTLANEADAWISRCSFEHEKKGRGENLAFNTGTDDNANIKTAFKDWYDEIYQYNYQGKVCGSSCHYTQLVWSTTREVGCAIKNCNTLAAFGKSVPNAWYIGCWYSPMGNDGGEFPYSNQGKTCEKCLEGQTCDNGLCVGVGKEVCEDKDPDCVMYEASGSCKTNVSYMSKKCRQACKFCEGGKQRECKDVSSDCERYGTSSCSSNPWMKPNCMKMCGFC